MFVVRLTLLTETSHLHSQTVERDDLQPMVIDGPEDLDRVLKICWMPNGFAQRLSKFVFRTYPSHLLITDAEHLSFLQATVPNGHALLACVRHVVHRHPELC